MPKNVIRRDPITGRWVIYAPQRGNRPHNLRSGSRSTSRVTPENCPFCPGHEDQIPPIIEETSGGTDHWQTRVFNNKYPALTERAPVPEPNHFYETRAAEGRHEVIVETPDHYGDLPDRTPEAVEALIRTYRSRFRAARAADDRLIPYVFHNHGAQAGASQPHPHSQLVAIPVVPESLRVQERRLHDYFRENGRCLVCDYLADEERNAVRVLAANNAFLATVPVAAPMPYEMRLIPRRHDGDFGTLTDDESDALAAMLADVLRRLRAVLGDVPYNCVVQPTTSFRDDARHAHWYVLVRPRGTGGGGFEVGSEMTISTSLPEDDAVMLRQATAE